MKRIVFLLIAVTILAGTVGSTATTSRNAVAQEAAPIFVKKIPAGYRDWKVVSVAHEAGELNDIRAVLGNDIAIKAYRDGKLPFANILKKDGYTVSVVQHPETSFAEDVKFTKADINRQSGPVVLVGHSYGGAVITEAGNDPKVAALVYISAFAPDTGESSASLEEAVPPAGKRIKETSDGYLYIDPASFAADFCADAPPDKAEFMAKSQVLFSKDSFTSPVTSPAWKTKPTWYMVATQDRSINPENERKMAKRANAKTVEVNSSHAAYISHPKETAKLIEEAGTSAPSNR